MAKDPYDLLGVKRDASDSEIQKAFRRLAKKSHPDLNPGDKKAEERFKELNTAYDILGDAAKRARFDRGEIDASGAEIRQNPFAGGRARGFGQQGGASGAENFAFDDLGDIFGGIFRNARGGGFSGGGFGGGFGGGPAQGEDSRFSLEVDFVDAVIGAKKRLNLPGAKSVDVNIPAGIGDGQTIRLKGQGAPGQGGPPGDALIEVKVRPHPLFRREGNDIHMELAVSLGEAVNGGKVEVPTVHGPVTLNIPAWSNAGTRMRLKGKGVPATKKEAAGDQYVTLKIVLPKTPDTELQEFIKSWSAKKPYDPRG